ncbi:hypothetical protein [Trichoplusia ni ascovirus 2c]|uniref:hypothetical protein n=1 Tax=Trichoplusia ni ascovirus 2c TaxID=328615 RepID=UPI0000E44213|nr:hypothetical protein TNAV2c_gp059 [Trichoplusia ni ascovirus 2c]ABF70576.1 hypothetical protein [Trichoplusia ni ascovirus 2c]AUS94163.1 HMG_Box/Yabby-like protein [Trichoplusia ni ascovirus 6b]
MANEALYQINALVTSVFYDCTDRLNDWNSTAKQRTLNSVLKRVLKIKNKRKRPMKPTAYNLFYKDQVPIIRREFPQISCRDIMPEAARRWVQYKNNNPAYLQERYGYKGVNSNN